MGGLVRTAEPDGPHPLPSPGAGGCSVHRGSQLLLYHRAAWRGSINQQPPLAHLPFRAVSQYPHKLLKHSARPATAATAAAAAEHTEWQRCCLCKAVGGASVVQMAVQAAGDNLKVHQLELHWAAHAVVHVQSAPRHHYLIRPTHAQYRTMCLIILHGQCTSSIALSPARHPRA
jgi:hypothetical protein